MSESLNKIPFQFEYNPNYFRKNDWFKPKPNGDHFKMYFLIGWCFARCSLKKRKMFVDHKEIELDPYEFVFGLPTCSEQTGLSIMEIRNRLKTLISSGHLEKSTGKSTGKFTIYKWIPESFCEIENRQINKELTRSQHADNNKRDIKTKDVKDIKDDRLGVVEIVHNSKVFPMNALEEGVMNNSHNLSSSFIQEKKQTSAQALSYSFKEIATPECIESTAQTKSDNICSVSLEQCLEILYAFTFADGQKIQGHVILRWLRVYSPKIIIQSLNYYQKMSKKGKISPGKHEAYLEKTLQFNFGAKDLLREGIKQRESLSPSLKESYK